MRLEVYSDEEDIEYVPKFKGNRELTEGNEEHIVATLRPMSGAELAKFQRGFAGDVEKAERAAKKLIIDRVVSLRGLRLDLPSETLRPSNGSELWAASQRFAAVLDPLVIELLQAIQDCSTLAEGDLKKFSPAFGTSSSLTQPSDLGSAQSVSHGDQIQATPKPSTHSSKSESLATGSVQSADVTGPYKTTYDQTGMTP